MNRITLGTAKLKYDADGDLQVGTFKPKIEITKEQLKGSDISKCANKTVEQVKDCAELLLASFFNKVSEIELRDIESTELKTEVISQAHYTNGALKEVEFEFVYIS